jgi:transposase
MSTRRSYSTDLCDEEWEILEPLVPNAKPGGRPEPTKRARAVERHFLRAEGRVRLEAASARVLLALAERLPLLLQGVAHRR